MKKIFLLITILSLASQAVFAALEEVAPVTNSNKKIQSIEEITAELSAKKAAEEPFNQKDVKVDVESLGLDSVASQPAAPAPNNAASAAINIEGNQQPSSAGILSKIQNFIAEKNIPIISKKNQDTPPSQNQEVITKSLKQIKREKLQKRIAEEKKKAAEKKAKEKKEAKEKRLNKLREEYLIKLDNKKSQEENTDEDFSTNSTMILPKEKNLRWSDRFISYDPPALPIIDPYRGNDNKHIPVIPTYQERINDLFYSIKTKNPAYFNATYNYVLDPNVHDANGETILTYSTLFQRYDVITSVLAKGADPDLPNALGHTAFDIAIELLDMKTANILVNMNADVNYVDGLGRTYLMHAARVGFLPMVDLLVSQGVDVNATDNEGFTALAIAYRHKKEIIAKFLLKSGAEPWIKKPYNASQQNLIKELETRWGPKTEENTPDKN